MPEFTDLLQMLSGQQGQGQQAPAPTPQQGVQGQQGLDPRKLIGLLTQPHKELNTPTVDPRQKQPGMGADIATGLLSMFLPVVGQAMKKHLKASKDAQINEAYSDFKQLHDSLEEAWMLSGGDQQKQMQIWEQLPGYKDIFDPNNPAAKKKLKNYAKIFNVDWLNPDKQKNTTQYQGLQKFMEAEPQSKIVEALHGKLQGMAGQGQGAQGMAQGAQGAMGGGQPQSAMGNPQPGGDQQPQQPGQGQHLPMHMTQPSPQIIEQLLKAGQQREEFQMTFERLREEHGQNLEARLENMRMHRDNMEQLHEDRMARLDQQKQMFGETKEIKEMIAKETERHHRELEQEARDRIQSMKELAQLRLDLARQKLEQSAMGGKLKEEYKAGLRVLHASLFGGSGQKGLIDSLSVLDNPASRLKLAALGSDFMQTTGTPDGIIGGLKKFAESKALNADEREYIRQMNRSIGAINALRTVTGLPRATQQLMERYVLELPNSLLDANSDEALEKLQLIQREIAAALDHDTSQGGGTMNLNQQQDETPPGKRVK